MVKREHVKWGNWRLNKRFLTNLYEQFKDREFTNNDAHEVYMEHHAIRQPYEGKRGSSTPHSRVATYNNGLTDPDEFRRMNVRNTLSKAAYEGILIRIAPGRYRFATVWNGGN